MKQNYNKPCKLLIIISERSKHWETHWLKHEMHYVWPSCLQPTERGSEILLAVMPSVIFGFVSSDTSSSSVRLFSSKKPQILINTESSILNWWLLICNNIKTKSFPLADDTQLYTGRKPVVHPNSSWTHGQRPHLTPLGPQATGTYT